MNMAFRMPPCKDAHGNECPERSLGCQGTCKRMKEYQEFLNEHDRAARQKGHKKNNEYQLIGRIHSQHLVVSRFHF